MNSLRQFRELMGFSNLSRRVTEKLFLFLEKIFKLLFLFFEKFFNLHITPVDYSSPIPSLKQLDPAIFDKVYACDGLDWNINEQKFYLNHIFPRYSSEFIPYPNSGLSPVDSFILYAMVREAKPKVMVEIGSGQSTKISLNALDVNAKQGVPGKLFAIEPYPRGYLKEIKNEKFTLIARNVQEVNSDFFKDADMLFIDSSHVLKIGSDVCYEILEILPKLKKGAIIHWHDIVIPRNYWKDWTYKATMFWNESYVLHSFLLFNSAFSVIWASGYMRLNYPQDLKAGFPYFIPEKQRCSSFWIKRIN